MSEAWLEDESGKIKIVWFNQPYLAKMIPEGAMVRVEGKIASRREEVYFSNPKIESLAKLPIAVGNSLFGKDGESHILYPIYPETKGLTSNWIFHKIQNIFSSGILDTLIDPIPEEILKRYSLPILKTALIWIHSPQKPEHSQAARKRFAFEEIFFIQLEKQKARHEFQEKKSFVIEKEMEDLENFNLIVSLLKLLPPKEKLLSKL